MKTYPIPMVPGPVKAPTEILQEYLTDYGSADLEPEYIDLYKKTEANFQKIFATSNQIALMTGEGMLALWAGLNSCLLPGDRVLAVASGLFGYGIGDMAKSIGCQVQTVSAEYDQTIHNWVEIEQAIVDFKPKMITAVHCETPSGTLNPIAELGELKKKHRVPLLYVDAVASAGGAPVETDRWGVDLMLGGSQKAFSVPPAMSIVAVSPQAWDIIDQVDYQGYDALKPFKSAVQDAYFPYTPYWQGLAALHRGSEIILNEGLENCFQRHNLVAARCREGIQTLGLELFPAPDAIPSPTVTAVKVPKRISWEALNSRLKEKGLAVGGNYGSLAGKVFRLGHMGSQADPVLMNQALEVLAAVLRKI